MEEEAADEENARGDELNRHRHAPGGGGVDVHVLVDAIIDPEAHERTHLIRYFEQTSQNASNRSDGQLGDVAGHRGGDGTASETGEDTTSI